MAGPCGPFNDSRTHQHCRAAEARYRSSVTAQLFRRFGAGRGAVLRPPTLRAGVAFGAGLLVVGLFASETALPVLALPVVLFNLRVLAVFAFAAFACEFRGAGASTIVSSSAGVAVSRAALRAGASRGPVSVFTGCQV